MNPAFISAFFALAGSIVGGLTSGVTTWMSLRSQAKTGHRLHRVAQREDLYRDFIAASSEAYGSAISNNEPQIHEVVVLYGMISRMRILSSPAVVVSAENTVDFVIDSYFTEGKTIKELRTMMKNGEAIDPLKAFSEVAREELRTF